MVSARLIVPQHAHTGVASALPADFHNVVLPWFEDRKIIEYGTMKQSASKPMDFDKVKDIHDRELAGINIYCPRQTIDDYEQFLCQEASLARTLLPEGLSARSVWLRGTPLRQFSPEAVTELIFRLSHYFSLNEDTCTVRGIELSPSALNGERIALLSGLRFNRINLLIDASIASDNRSLSKLDSVFTHLADFKHITVEARIVFGSDSHPQFLSRLLAYLRHSACDQLSLSLDSDQQPQSLTQRQTSANLLGTALTEMSDEGWDSLGNNQFISQRSPLHQKTRASKLHLTPWGFQEQQYKHWLGLGIGAMGRIRDTYYRNDPAPEVYTEAIGKRTLPPKTLYAKPYGYNTGYNVAYNTFQDLLSEHRVEARMTENVAGMAALFDTDWLSDAGEYYLLTPLGIKNLFAIHTSLFTHAIDENYNAPIAQ